MNIVSTLLSSIAVLLGYKYILRDGDIVRRDIFAFIRDAILSNFLAIITGSWIINNATINSIVDFTQNSYVYTVFQIVLALIFAAAVILLTGFSEGRFLYKKDNSDNKKHNFIRIISIILFALGSAALTGTVWGLETFGDLSPDQMIINIFSPTEGTSDDVMITLWKGPVLQTAVLTVLFALAVFSKRVLSLKNGENSKNILTLKLRRIICLILSLAMLAGGVAYGVEEFELIKLSKMYVMKSSFIEDNYADPREVKMEFPEKKRNLIHIYLESMENSYLSTDLGGYMDENLMEPLTELAKEGYSFSHLDKGFGGPVSTTGCTWSVASMVNMNTGLPMKAPVDANSYGTPGNFLPGAVTIGDILAAQGYEQTLMFGATATFGGLRYFYETHGDFNILDYDAAKEKGWIPSDYKVWWGYEDDKLYEFAKQELTRLYETGKPFNFVMETADTHFPDGYVSENTPMPRDNQYANVIAYSASEVTKFVRWIQQQPFYENTTIVLIGDHLSMDSKFFADFDPDYLRTTFNLILNPADTVKNIPQERMQNRWWYNGDMFPTVLASLGVKIDGEKLGLGTNLFSDVPTLFEEHGGEKGWKKVSSEFEIRSIFYNENILEGEQKVFDNRNVSVY